MIVFQLLNQRKPEEIIMNMHVVLKNLELADSLIREIRDNQEVIPCGDDNLPCLCNDIDAILDKINATKVKMLRSEIKIVETVLLPEIDEYIQNGIHEERKGILAHLEYLGGILNKGM